MKCPRPPLDGATCEVFGGTADNRGEGREVARTSRCVQGSQCVWGRDKEGGRTYELHVGNVDLVVGVVVVVAGGDVLRVGECESENTMNKDSTTGDHFSPGGAIAPVARSALQREKGTRKDRERGERLRETERQSWSPSWRLRRGSKAWSL